MINTLPPINISTSDGFFAWNPAAWLRVTGPDTAAFLQGQFTQDLRQLEGQRAVYGLWLSVKGKIIADSFVLRGAAPEEFWIGSYTSPAAIIRERLEHHIIADDVIVEDMTGEWSAVSLFGGTAEATRAAHAADFVFAGRRTRPANTEWIFRRHEQVGVRSGLEAFPELSPETINRWRIQAGIAAIPVDAGPTDLPPEANLEADTISYQKGCYLGQEVMARLKSMGQVRRRLLRVCGGGPTIPVLPAPLYHGAATVGELRSAVPDVDGGFVGLAMLSLLKLRRGAELAFTPDGGAAIHVLDAP